MVKTGGKVTIWGFDIDAHPRNAKRAIGIVPEIIFDPFFTPRETLEIQAGLYGIPPSQRKSDGIARGNPSPWYDYITRDLMRSGELARLIAEDGLLGMTSNPTIFEKAIAGSDLYDEEIRRQSGEGRPPPRFSRRWR